MEIEDRRIRKSMAGLDDQIKGQGSHREGGKRNFTMMGEKQEKRFLLSKHNARNLAYSQKSVLCNYR